MGTHSTYISTHKIITIYSRYHQYISFSDTIVIPNFYNHFGLGKALRDEFNSDTFLEYEDQEIYHHFWSVHFFHSEIFKIKQLVIPSFYLNEFSEFQRDVLAELQSFGKIMQFKVCSNYQTHLRGNVYVQYSTQKEAIRAYLKLQGRWYDGRQLSCHFVSIPSWRSAICGTKTFQMLSFFR